MKHKKTILLQECNGKKRLEDYSTSVASLCNRCGVVFQSFFTRTLLQQDSLLVFSSPSLFLYILQAHPYVYLIFYRKFLPLVWLNLVLYPLWWPFWNQPNLTYQMWHLCLITSYYCMTFIYVVLISTCWITACCCLNVRLHSWVITAGIKRLKPGKGETNQHADIQTEIMNVICLSVMKRTLQLP